MFPLTLGMGDEIIAIVTMGGAMLVAIVAIMTGAVRSIMISRHREESRREIAAYVAEGSMTPDDAARLIAAGNPPPGKCGARWTNKA